jgi:flagellar hook assembly protein FlgD
MNEAADQSDWERVRAASDFEWDGHDDEDRSLSKEEMRVAISRTKQSRKANPKVSTTT